MDQYMETKLDSLYYRTPAQPHLCGPYKNATNYNSINSIKNTAKSDNRYYS